MRRKTKKTDEKKADFEMIPTGFAGKQ